MAYLLAVLLPPVAVSRYGSWGQCLINLNLTAYGWAPGVIHALMVVRAACGQATLRDLARTLGDLRADEPDPREAPRLVWAA